MNISVLKQNESSENVNQPVELKNTKILIADDSRTQRLLLKEQLTSANYQVICAYDGVEATELFVKERPDLVILDIEMPRMDGIEAAQKIREFDHDEYVPIIFLTEFDDENNLNRCIAVGGDDFISKQSYQNLLLAKINLILRYKHHCQEQLEQRKQLLEYKQKVVREQEVAATLYKNIIQAEFLEIPNLRYSLSPMALFNGDILLTAKTPGNHLCCLLGDFTGHGLSASIGAGPAAEIFYGMTKKGFGAVEILTEINQKMHKILPVNMFLAATMVTLNPDARILNATTCGLPDHYLVNQDTGLSRVITSKNLPLGINVSVDLFEQHFEVSAVDYLYFFTDGVIEAEDQQGQQFGIERIAACLSQTDKSGFNLIQHELQLHSRGLNQQDDITLVELKCDVDSVPWETSQNQSCNSHVVPLPWKSTMEFHISTLQNINPVPVMVNSLMEIQGLQNHRESIFVIVSELFTNSLEHGLLKLESRLKQTSDGFMEFFELREQRLKSAKDGQIKVLFNHQPINNGGRLIIRVLDSGAGFDFNKVFSAIDDNQEYFGRGIQLVKKLCKEVVYLGNGNCVKAVFEWKA